MFGEGIGGNGAGVEGLERMRIHSRVHWRGRNPSRREAEKARVLASNGNGS